MRINWRIAQQEMPFSLIASIVFCGVFGIFSEISAQTLPIFITEVQIAGEKVSYDFIELYNASDASVDLIGYRLRKRTSSGNESSIASIGFKAENFHTTVIPAKGYFLWASSKEDYHIQAGAQIFTTQTIAADNSIALMSPSPENIIIDAVAWGDGLTDPFVLGNPFSQNPEAKKSLSRWIENGQYRNSQNNSVDFTIADVSTPGQDNVSVVQTSLPPQQPSPVPLPVSPLQPQIPPPPQPQPQPPSPPSPSLTPVNDPPQENSTPQPEIQNEPSDQAPEKDAPQETQNTEVKPIAEDTKIPKIPKIAENTMDSPAAPIKEIEVLNPHVNEFLPYPEGNDAEEEWIELYNPHDDSIDISGWVLEDTQGKKSTFSILPGTIMRAKEFLVFSRPKTGLTLNNDSEGVVLKNKAGKIVNTAEYQGKAKRAYSYARKENGNWAWDASPTPGKENIFAKTSSTVLGAGNSSQESGLHNEPSDLRTGASLANFSSGGATNTFTPTILVAGFIALFSSAGIVALKILLRR